ncbi:MAG: peroxidase [Gemmatimonadales bacterium]
MKEASYVLIRIRDAEKARAWLGSAPVTTAVEMNPPPSTALQVAFTAAGLEALGIPRSVIAGFSAEFVGGMTEDSRTRRLGDVNSNSPSEWAWGTGNRLPHLVAMFFAEPGLLHGFIQSTKGASWDQAFEELRTLTTENLDGVEPFGFADGISQPGIDWNEQRDHKAAQVTYTNVAALGEFLLGYRNEYNKYTDRPLLDADADSAGLLPAQDAPEKKDLGRNGTYMVMRDLRQDVRAFWQFIDRQSGGNVEEREKLGAALVGRTRAGDPLVPVLGPKNEFTFERDQGGARCPFGAHVHRANPRNADYPLHPTGLARLLTIIGFGPREFRDDLMSPVRFHRVLRRGREYGPELLPTDALEPGPDDEPSRGLHFICLNANISRQFEFLQNAWMMNTKFSGLSGESDPLLGDRESVPGCPATDGFTIPVDGGLPRRLSGVPQFVTVRGGAYFFLPSIRALHYFVKAGSSGPQ